MECSCRLNSKFGGIFMLSIYWGVTKDCCYYIDDEYREAIEMQWFNDPLVQDIIADIDNCKFDGTGCVDLDDSAIKFSVYELSTGSKGLILLAKDTYDSIRIWGTAFGDNCAKWILKIARDRNITLELEHDMNFPPESFSAFSIKQNSMYKDYEDYRYEERHWGYKAWCQ